MPRAEIAIRRLGAGDRGPRRPRARDRGLQLAGGRGDALGLPGRGPCISAGAAGGARRGPPRGRHPDLRLPPPRAGRRRARPGGLGDDRGRDRAERRGPSRPRRRGAGRARLSERRRQPGRRLDSHRPGAAGDDGCSIQPGRERHALGRVPARLRPRLRGRAGDWLAWKAMATRVEEHLWGGETTKAVENFQISGQPIPPPVIHWLGRLKAAAARTNAELGNLDADLAEKIAEAGDAVAAGEQDDQFPIDVFQTGSGTSSNMNANEVIANARRRRGPPQRPRQHGAVLQRRLPVGGPPGGAGGGPLRSAAGPRRARGRPGAQGRGVQGHRQGRPHPPDGRGAGDPRAGVRRLRRPGAARSGAGALDPWPGRPDPARRHRHRNRAQHPSRVRGEGAREAQRRHRPRRSPSPPTASRRRATATPWSSSPGR